MNIEALRLLHQTRPFVPFTMCLADGRKLFVKHNEYLAVAPTGGLAVLTHDHGRFTMIDTRLIVTADQGDLSEPKTSKA